MKELQSQHCSMESSKIPRRTFVKYAVRSTGILAAAPAFLRGSSLNSKLDIAIIGTGGRGAENTEHFASENVVALCDINAKNLAAAAEKYPRAQKFADFRKLFESVKSLDAVVVSTSEHTHAFVTMLALRLNKHVYCEKPLTHSVWEARQIREMAGKRKLATQMGIQIHASSNYRRVVEVIQDGAIGPVREVHVWVSRAWGMQSKEAANRNEDIVFVTERPHDAQPVPDGVNWDLWLGPAPSRPFNSVYLPGPKWYRWWDFGNGTMSDLGSHWIDLPFWALRLQAPITIEAIGPPPHSEIAPATMKVTYEYGPREQLPAVRLNWYQGEVRPPQWLAGAIPKWNDGCLFVGDKGMLLANYGRHVLLPEKDFEGYEATARPPIQSLSHHNEWIEACRTGKPTSADFHYSGLLTEANHLGNVAYRTGKKLIWNPDLISATNAPEADQFIRREYRNGWTL